jgi:outer membrane protein TolC
MKTRAFLAMVLLAGTASAQPRHHRHEAVAQADAQPADPSEAPGAHGDADDGDGPEAKAMLPVKLDDLIDVAVRLAPDLARAKVDRSVAIDTAAGVRRDRAWVLTSHAEYSRSATADHVEVPPFTVVAQDQTSGGIGLAKNLPTGGQISVEADLAHTNVEYNVFDRIFDGQGSAAASSPTGTNQNGNPYEFVSQNQTKLAATLKQPLARGFGPDVALANEKKADLAATEATIKAQLAAEEMVRDIVVAYWELAYSSFEVDVRTQGVDLAKKQDQLTHEQIRAGAAPSTALGSTTYEIATRQEALLRAQLDLEQKSLDLRRKSGLEIGKRDIVVKPGEVFDVGQDDFDVEETLARSRQANRQLATVQLEKKIADVDLAVAQDQIKPQLDLELQGALIGQGDSTGESLGAVGDSFQVTAGISMSFEISGAARRNRDAAQAKKHRLDIDRADLERQIDVQVVTSVQQVTAARTRVALADTAIAVAEDNVRAERASFMAGRSTNFQVMQQQGQLIDARLARGRAVADYHEAVAQLQFLSGVLLEQYRVNVRPHHEAE